MKAAQLILAGSNELWGRWGTAILGASVAILEGFQQLDNLWAS